MQDKYQSHGYNHCDVPQKDLQRRLPLLEPSMLAAFPCSLPSLVLVTCNIKHALSLFTTCKSQAHVCVTVTLLLSYYFVSTDPNITTIYYCLPCFSVSAIVTLFFLDAFPCLSLLLPPPSPLSAPSTDSARFLLLDIAT